MTKSSYDPKLSGGSVQINRRSIHYRVIGMQRDLKKCVMVLIDLLALCVALWSGYALRLADWWPEEHLMPALPLFMLVPVAGVLMFIKLGLYRAVIRFMSTDAVKSVVVGVALLSLSLYALVALFKIDPFPSTVPINFGLAALLYVGGTRVLLRSYYRWLIQNFVKKEGVLIYGAGGAGVQLASLLEGGAEYTPIGFLDDNPSLWKSSVMGLPVYPPDALGELIEEEPVSYLLLALPKASGERRRQILEQVSGYPIQVKTMPSMPDLISGQSIDSIRDVEIDDLLGRDPVTPDSDRISASLVGKTVMITGAGGSIGAEIARQVLHYGAARIVLLELSEYALYSIDQELQAQVDKREESSTVEIIPVLGSVTDAARMTEIMKHFGVQSVYHAAAYKHVPLVEHNVVQGVLNNTLGTRCAALAAIEAGVERFILISTDKAVRPTNMMGASKRLAELILQDLAAQRQARLPIFSMVRFGNVLGSSGSVVPLFKSQIERGGPVTVTHPEVNRFFMTISEATSLVLQAGSMAEGGDVFVLDMGEPVKILDLARRMIRLSGLSLKSANSPDGDIAIEFTGLRPGEKLYEELLIGRNVTGTEHPKIMRAEEERLASDELNRCMEQLMEAIQRADSEIIRAIMLKAVSGYQPSSANVDWLSADHSGVQPSITETPQVH